MENIAISNHSVIPSTAISQQKDDVLSTPNVHMIEDLENAVEF